VPAVRRPRQLAIEHTAPLPHEQCYRAVQSRDARFDGVFVTAVHTTGIYCRPSCPAITPRAVNVSFFATAAAAQQRGFRACKRCRPDASPGSPEWNVRADAVARAMRLIADGVIDRDGVPGLANRLGYSERHLNRLVTDELGAGPLAIARAQRAQTARLLIETTSMPMTDVAFAAGFASIRQFNDTIREVFDLSPTAMRAGRRSTGSSAAPSPAGTVELRLPVRGPFDARHVFEFLGARAVPGVESWDGTTYRLTLRLPKGPATVSLRVPALDAASTDRPTHVACTLQLTAVADLQSAVQRCRRLLDLDADPVAIDEVLGADPVLAPLVLAHPGRRSPGSVDGAELLVRAILGQQVSVSGARTIAGRLAMLVAEPASAGAGGPADAGVQGDGPHLLFPSAAALAELDPDLLPMPVARRRALQAACAALAAGDLVIDPGADRGELVERLERLPGIGPWTSAYVRMRALGDPDVFLPTDLGVRHALERLGAPADPAAAGALATAWQPWRSYALHHLWATLDKETT
jgi:AraC family transcriptional regulator of adaptative response / DNA-3-methyladenine glycosylase II